MIIGPARAASSGSISNVNITNTPSQSSMKFRATSTAGGAFTCILGTFRGPLLGGQLNPGAGATDGATVTLTDGTTGAVFTFTTANATKPNNLPVPTGGVFPAVFNGDVTCAITGLGNAQTCDISLYVDPTPS